MIVAGAGSGKTRVLAYRAAYLVEKGLARPWEILALTFTNKSAGELRCRASTMIGHGGDNLQAGTFHSIFSRIMRQEGLNIGIDPRFTIVDADDRRKLIKTILKENGSGVDSAREVTWFIERAKNDALSPDQFSAIAHRPLEILAASVYHTYEARLRKMAGLDFDDLLLRPLEAFRKHPEFLERLQNRFKYIMVDEFQDTNPAQYNLIKAIALGHRNLCVVGDDDQAIYAFRGATVANILEFKRDWNETKIIRLEQNYRSHKFILDLAWSVIKNNPQRHEKKLWTARKDGEPALLIEARTDEEEALEFTAFIRHEASFKSRSLKDFAILYRTNAQSLAFERALRGAGLPYQVIGGLKFYERKEIKDILAYLRVLVNPADDISLDRIINYPPRGIGDTLLADMHQQAHHQNVTLFDIVRINANNTLLAPRSRKALIQFLEMWYKFQQVLGSLSFAELVKTIIITIGLRERLLEEEKDDPSRADSKVENIENFVADVTRFTETTGDKGIAEFLEEVSLVTDVDRMDETQEHVNLLTIHTSKGLEFPVVLLGGIEEGILPLTSPDGSSTEVEEERRLFFVAVTRAMDRLVLSYTRERLRFGTRMGMIASRYLREIPPELLTGTKRTTFAPQSQRYSPPRPFPARPVQAQTAPLSNSSGTRLDADELHKGLLVKHPTFGLGVIIDFRKQGSDSSLAVDFDEVGKKTLILKYARLEKVR